MNPIEQALRKKHGIPMPEDCPHPTIAVFHVLRDDDPGYTVCNQCLHSWPDAKDGTWTGPLKGKTPK